MVTAKIIDMTNVKEGGRSFNKKRVAEGDYLARVLKVEDAEIKKGENKGQFQWLFTIVLEKHPTAKYPYYCALAENQLWKVRNLLVAAGINVPKKKVKLDPEKVVGKLIAVTMEDDEYDGKLQSNISTIFPPSELEGGVEDDDVEDADDDDDDEEETPPPAKKKKKAAPEPEEDEDEEEEEAPKPKKKKRAPEPEPEDGEDEDEPEPPKKKAKKKPKVTDEELEELDIEDV
jgi:hypothetical protein